MRTLKNRGGVLLLAVLVSYVAYAQSSDVSVGRIIGNPRFRSAQEFLDKDHDRLIKEIIQITEIPAPPFKEGRRGQAFMEMLKQSGLTNVEIDAVGNVIGVRKGTGDGPAIAIAAHLDTVFPEGTNVTVKREGTRLMAPGIGDDSRALAVLLAIVRAMDVAQIQTRADILFIGNVGEEGQGDLRGMKYLFEKGAYKDHIKRFISLDGAGIGSTIVNGGLPSKRYHVTFTGPGGHSWASFGTVNPAYAMAKAIDKLSRMEVPASPRTTYNVGVVSGGTSVNSIPYETSMEVDLRSESTDELTREAATFSRLMHEAVNEENIARSTAQGKIDVDIKLIGDRPQGSTSSSSAFVQTAAQVIHEFGMQAMFLTGSTDANVPMSLHIPSMTLESGANGGRAHALDEWIDVEKTSSLKGMYIILGTLLTLAGIQ